MINGFGGNEETPCYLRVAAALGDQLKDLDFPRGQAVGIRTGPGPRPAGNPGFPLAAQLLPERLSGRAGTQLIEDGKPRQLRIPIAVGKRQRALERAADPLPLRRRGKPVPLEHETMCKRQPFRQRDSVARADHPVREHAQGPVVDAAERQLVSRPGLLQRSRRIAIPLGRLGTGGGHGPDALKLPRRQRKIACTIQHLHR
jgi:hypothetical protein